MKQSLKIALCGIIAALSTVVMFLAGVLPVVTIALPALAGCLLIAVVTEVGPFWGLGVYAVCGALSLLLIPDREAALFYLLFFGYYPVLIAFLGRIGNKVLRYAVKLLVFNAAAVCEALAAVFILGIPLDSVFFLGPWTPVVLLVLANLVFLLYDRALDGLILLYIHRLHPVVARLMKVRS